MGDKINEGFLVPLEEHFILHMSQLCAMHISHGQWSDSVPCFGFSFPSPYNEKH